MRHKQRVGGDKMSVVEAEVQELRRMADFLIRKEGGCGDKLTWAAYQAERKWGAPASILLRLRNRHEIKDMKLSNGLAVLFAALAAGYDRACEQSESVADQQEKIAKDTLQDAANSKLLTAAAYLARPKDGAAK